VFTISIMTASKMCWFPATARAARSFAIPAAGSWKCPRAISAARRAALAAWRWPISMATGPSDVVYPTPNETAYYQNTTPHGHSFTVGVVGPNGEHNQFGRVIHVFPPGTNQIYTRVVDGGSGYLTQNQYPILVGTPFSGAHAVKVYFAPLAKCVYGGPPCHAAILSFSISPGQRALAYAPSAANPSGRAVITAGT
jgi:hypothetical protein